MQNNRIIYIYFILRGRKYVEINNGNILFDVLYRTMLLLHLLVVAEQGICIYAIHVVMSRSSSKIDGAAMKYAHMHNTDSIPTKSYPGVVRVQIDIRVWLGNHIPKKTIIIMYIINIQYIPRNMHTVFALLCFVVVIHWLIFPYPSGLLHWHCGNLTIAPVPVKQPWWIWINTSCEFIMNDCITTTKQSTTKPCAYFLGYTVIQIQMYIPLPRPGNDVEFSVQHICIPIGQALIWWGRLPVSLHFELTWHFKCITINWSTSLRSKRSLTPHNKYDHKVSSCVAPTIDIRRNLPPLVHYLRHAVN